ncbi:MAG: 1-acyl-sn-glycerol-3-phosphate acyltransferase [Bacteroidia bacterium]|nr:1-acyl-sn-glycerol-3-phosphate acyltransferase [Bacteroidia bacterium]
MVQLLRSLYMVYGLLIFTVQLLVYAPFFVLGFAIFGKSAERPLGWIAHKVVGPTTMLLCLVFLQTRGKKTIRGTGPHIIVSNHSSFLDILLNAAAYPGTYKWLSKKEMAKVPIFGVVVKGLCIFVDRRSPESRQQSYEDMKSCLENGSSILLYPEGTRNRTGEPLQPFYDGAFRLASETGFPLAVNTLKSPGKLASPHRPLDLRPGIVHAYWDLIPDTQARDIEDLKSQVRGIMISNLGE